jgi:hypothetical protein
VLLFVEAFQRAAGFGDPDGHRENKVGRPVEAQDDHGSDDRMSDSDEQFHAEADCAGDRGRDPKLGEV